MSSIEVSVTHEIKIGYEKAWGKVGITHDCAPGEKYRDEIDRIDSIVQRKVLDVIQSTVQTVENFEGGK